jgi:transposase
VRPLTEQQRALLESAMKNDASHRARMRAHGLLLSSEGMTIKAIAKIYHVDRDTVSTWIKKWEKHGDKSLHDQPRSGRPAILNTTEKERAKQYIKEEPRSLKNVAERFAQKTATRLSMSSLKRLAKKARLRWKRVRKSLKSLTLPILNFSEHSCPFPAHTWLCTKSPVREMTRRSMRPSRSFFKPFLRSNRSH